MYPLSVGLFSSRTLRFELFLQLMKKEKELQLAAELGKEMLAENDDLQLEIDELKKGHEEQIRVRESIS